MPQKLLGDRVKSALALVGVTEERVQNALGVEDCGCEKRRQQLNELDLWARRLFSKGMRGMKHNLTKILRGWEDEE